VVVSAVVVLGADTGTGADIGIGTGTSTDTATDTTTATTTGAWYCLLVVVMSARYISLLSL